MARRVIEIRYDVIERVHRDSEGEEILQKDEWPRMHFQENVLVLLRLVSDSSLTPYQGLSATEIFTASVACDFKHGVMMAKTQNEDINVPGDWELDSTGDADPTQGEFAIRIDGNTARYLEKVGTLEEVKRGCLELKSYDEAGNITHVIQIPFRTFNTQDENSDLPPEPADDYYTKAECEARFLRRGAGGTVSISNGADSVTVSGLAMDSIPDHILVSVRKPSGGTNIFAMVRDGSESRDGFIADLSTAAPVSGYALDYLIVIRGEAAGSQAIAAGVDFVQVTGLGLASAPDQVIVNVRKALSTDDNIFGTIRGTPTTDGFIVDLSAIPSGVGYVLDYLLVL